MAFAGSIYLARTLGVGLYGVIGLAGAVLLYFTALAEAGTESIGVRDLASNRANLAAIVPDLLGFRAVWSGLLAVVFIVGSILLLPPLEGTVVALYGLTLLPFGANVRWIHLGLEQGRPVAVARTCGEVLVLSLVLTLVHQPGDVWRVPVLQLAGDTLAAVLLVVTIVRAGVPLTLRFSWRPVLHYARHAWPIVAHSLLGLIIFNSDFIFLRAFWDNVAVGYYVAAYALISFLLNLGVAYGQSLLPTLSRLDPAGPQQDLYHSAMAHLLLAALPLSIGGFLLAGPIIGLVFGPTYVPAARALACLVWTIPVAFLRMPPQAALITRHRQDRMMQSAAWSAGLNAGLNFLLIPRWGIVGAAVATLGTECLRTGLVLLFVRREGFRRTPSNRFHRSLLAGLVLAGALVLVRGSPLWIAIPVGGVVYLGVLVVTGGISFRDGPIPSILV